MLKSRLYFITRSNQFNNKLMSGTHVVEQNGLTTLFNGELVVGVFNLAPGESIVVH